MDPTSYSPTTGTSSASEAAGTVQELKTAVSTTFAPKSRGKFEGLLKRLVTEISTPKPLPGGSKSERNIQLQGISVGKEGEFNIRLASGGGFANVALTNDGAKFTMSTPAYLQNSPGITTQNVLEFDVDFSDLSPKKHAQLINELKSALKHADTGAHKKSEGPLIDQALEILNSTEVCKACTTQSAVDALKALLNELLDGASIDDLHDCKNGFDALIPEPAVEPFRRVYTPDPIIDVFKADLKDAATFTDSEWSKE